MSIRVMTEIWEHSHLSGTPLLVMLALADFANDERLCWPAISTVARKTRISPRQAQRTVRRMVKQGHLVAYEGEGRHGTNLYRIPDPDLLQTLPDLQAPVRGDDADDTPDTGDTPDMDDRGGMSPMTPNPSGTVNRTINGAPALSPSLPLADSLAGDAVIEVKKEVRQVRAKKEACAVKVKGGSAAKPKHEMTATPAQVRELVAHFCHKTGKAAPDLRVTGSYGKMKVLWDFKVDDYFALMGNDMARAKDAIDFAVSKLPPDMIVSPKSLENIIMANRERIPRGNTATSIGGGAVSMPG